LMEVPQSLWDTANKTLREKQMVNRKCKNAFIFLFWSLIVIANIPNFVQN